MPSWLHIFKHMCVRVCQRSEDIHLGAGSLIPPCGSLGLNSGCQAWQQARLPTEPSSVWPVLHPSRCHILTLVSSVGKGSGWRGFLCTQALRWLEFSEAWEVLKHVPTKRISFPWQASVNHKPVSSASSGSALRRL